MRFSGHGNSNCNRLAFKPGFLKARRIVSRENLEGSTVGRSKLEACGGLSSLFLTSQVRCPTHQSESPAKNKDSPAIRQPHHVETILDWASFPLI
jgi:hypothetical protein